ncbi:MAG: D-alanine aminotransferase [Phycisphaerae bacterium]|nr:D-alanine aminotransferase [Phycisphaerae bacterium]
MADLAFINGEFLPLTEAKISIEDRGFQFADGVYEVVVFHRDRPLLLREHLQRLENSCRSIRLNFECRKYNLETLIQDGVRRAGNPDTMVYIQVTRGVAPRNHVWQKDMEPTVVMTFKAKPVYDAGKRRQGLSIRTMLDFRWSRCDIKSIALLANILAKNQAIAEGYDDVLFTGPGEELREASASNFFLVQEGHLLTHPQDHTILPGITKLWITQLAREIDLPISECRMTRAHLATAAEAFISSSTIDVLPVVRVDQQTIGSGRPGPVADRLYQQMLQDRC